MLEEFLRWGNGKLGFVTGFVSGTCTCILETDLHLLRFSKRRTIVLNVISAKETVYENSKL